MTLVRFLGWTAAFITEIVEFNAYSPTVVECLAFWVASAMSLPGCSQVPQVGPEPPSGGVPCTLYDVMGQRGDAALALSLL